MYPRSEGDVYALDHVTLAIPRGSSTVITGPSGSGKSTLLFLIAGLARPSEGHVTVLGQNLAGMNDDELADMRRSHIGFVFQNYHLIPTLTVCENVMLPLTPARLDALKVRAKALHCIEQVGLQKRINHLPGELSGGEQQRVALARALMNNPELILADEPTGNLDPESADTILSLLLDLGRSDCRTVILTSHNRDVAGRCEHQIRMEAGRLVP
ncbi:MAG: ABC transporter ATP-binding protein [Kiritimatiellaeota bacterium]|nr:ABC transporter ATP-binding protein [Kiritimatiellota bacterium]